MTRRDEQLFRDAQLLCDDWLLFHNWLPKREFIYAIWHERNDMAYQMLINYFAEDVDFYRPSMIT